MTSLRVFTEIVPFGQHVEVRPVRQSRPYTGGPASSGGKLPVTWPSYLANESAEPTLYIDNGP